MIPGPWSLDPVQGIKEEPDPSPTSGAAGARRIACPQPDGEERDGQLRSVPFGWLMNRGV